MRSPRRTPRRNKRLAALQDEIDFGLRALDERRAALKGRHDEAQRQIEDRTAEWTGCKRSLEARQQEIEESRRSMAAELAAAAPIGGNKSVEPIGPSLESEIEATTEATDRDEDPAAKASARPAKNEPVGLAPSLGGQASTWTPTNRSRPLATRRGVRPM